MKLNFCKKNILVLLVFSFSAIFLFGDTYKVEKGDTLYSISKKYQLTVNELRAANNLSENDVIKVGQKLTIPNADISAAAALSTNNSNSTSSVNNSIATKNYTIVKGDTLYSIAKKNNISLAELLAMNSMDSSSVIKIGQTIKIPSDKNSSSGSNNSNTATTVISQAPDTRTYGTTVTADKNTVWPVKNPTVTQIKGKVSGVQLSAKQNEPVVCIREGTVMYVGVYRGFGQVLFVQSKTGVIYTYTGLGSVSVKKGDYVTYNQQLGTAGIDAISNKPGITFMVFQNGKPIDPATAPRN